MSDSIIQKDTEAKTVAHIAREGMTPVVHQTPSTPVLLWPKDQKIESLERFNPTPVRKRAAVVVDDHQSFINYLTAHREPGTMIFAVLSETGGRFVAQIDYHHPNVDGKLASQPLGEPRFASHTCTLEMRHTPEWQRWAAKDDEDMAQTDFALFLEDNRLDILDPSAGQVIDIAKSLEAESGSRFKSAIRLDNGDRKFSFETETTAKAGVTGELTIPDKFKLRMPVFLNGPTYDVDAFFRYRIGSPLKMRYALIRPHKVVELALIEARNAIEAALSLPVLAGVCTVPSIG